MRKGEREGAEWERGWGLMGGEGLGLMGGDGADGRGNGGERKGE